MPVAAKKEIVILRIEDLLGQARGLVVNAHVPDAKAADTVLEGIDLHQLLTVDYEAVERLIRTGFMVELNRLSAVRETVTVNYNKPTTAKGGSRSSTTKVRESKTKVVAVEPTTITVAYLAREYTVPGRGKYKIADMTGEDLRLAWTHQEALGNGHLQSAKVLKATEDAVNKRHVETAAELLPADHKRIERLANSLNA